MFDRADMVRDVRLPLYQDLIIRWNTCASDKLFSEVPKIFPQRLAEQSH